MEDFSVWQGEKTYKELFYDSDFYDSDNSSDVTWDTANNRIDFLADGVAQTTPIFKDSNGNQQINSIIFNFENTGDITFKASADGGTNWETLSGTSHSFTNRGYELLIKAEETSSAVAQITYMEVKYG